MKGSKPLLPCLTYGSAASEGREEALRPTIFASDGEDGE